MNQPPKRSFYIGRWQPLHAGHIGIIRQALDAGRDVVVGIMDTPQSERNPYSVGERVAMFREAFPGELGDGRLDVLPMPWIDEVCYGRNCGWRTRRVRQDPELEEITATDIRAALEGCDV